MKTKLLIVIAALCVVTLSACHKDDLEFNREFTVDSDDVNYDSSTATFSFRGERQTVMIDVATGDATGKWVAFCPTDDIWCTVSQSGGKLVVTVDNNETGQQRSTTITITLGDTKKVLGIVQGYLREMYFTTGEITTGARPNEYFVELVTNVLPGNMEFKITENSSSEDWLEIVSYEDGTVKFRTKRNTSVTDSRTVTILAMGDNEETELYVNQNAANGPVLTVPLNSIDLSFKNEYTYKIMDPARNIQVGVICREYLFKCKRNGKETVVESAAIVAYPTNESGKPDHGNGLVIALIEDGNGSDPNYSVTVEADGGSVRWNSIIVPNTLGEDMISSYTQGDEQNIQGNPDELPENIYLGLGESSFSLIPLTQEEEALSTTCNLEPWTVKDIRTGLEIMGHGTTEEWTYRVVKVGPFYWFAENLRTLRYPDGTPIPTDNRDDWENVLGMTVASVGNPNNATTGYSNNNAHNSKAGPGIKSCGPVYNLMTLYRASQSSVENPYTGRTSDQLSPRGWRVPMKTEFIILNSYMTQTSDNPSTDPKFGLVMYGELEKKATNITRFNAQGMRYKTPSGNNSSNGTNYATIDGYNFTGNMGSGQIGNHKSTAFCCGQNTTVSMREIEARWCVFVRCIQRQ